MKRLQRAAQSACGFGAIALAAFAIHEMAIGATVALAVAALLGSAGVADLVELVRRR
jgi:hypothetical protein